MPMVDDWGMLLTLMGVKPATAQQWAPVFDAEIKPGTLSLGLDELDDLLSQLLHESGMLERLEENLNYTTAERIRAVWPSRFPTLASAAPFVRNPRALANKVYGGRMGNHFSDDGWQYRGRGLIMVTGRDNYRALEAAINVPLIVAPDMLTRPDIALRASIAWWEKNVPDGVMGNVERVTRRVNGGVTGMAHRAQLAAVARKVLA